MAIIVTFAGKRWAREQFIPLPNSQAAQGEINKMEKIAEIKVEMLCAPDDITAVIQALRTAHPFEQPSYQAWVVNNF